MGGGFLLGLLSLVSVASAGVAVSPDGRNEIRLLPGGARTGALAYEVLRDGVVVVAPSAIGISVNGSALAVRAADAVVTRRRRSGTLETPIYRKSRIELSANETYVCLGDWGVRLVARNDGVAYRLETRRQGQVRIDGETADVTIPENAGKAFFCLTDRYGCEQTVPKAMSARDIPVDTPEKRRLVYLPFAYSVRDKSVAVTESDVRDYPVWYLARRTESSVLVADFAHYPKTVAYAEKNRTKKTVEECAARGRYVIVKDSERHLVETDGERTFPWRVFVLGDSPSVFCSSDIVMALATPADADADFTWVKPGKVAWDWWNAWDNQGAGKGCNTATYRRFIDFASRHGVEYVILDEGWSEKLDIWKFHPNVDVPELIRYGREKGVGIILWMAWAQVVGREEKVAAHFAELGAKGFKVDFIDRGDAAAERFIWDCAKACAKHRLLVDYHGVHRPTGLQRAYPNVLNYEGVHGLECCKWYNGRYDFMGNDVGQFFLRMTAGAMDYTPGAMDNYPVDAYKGTYLNPGSMGTRCRQIAMMVAYEAPLQMLCDAPTKYERELESFAFMTRVPVVWQATIGLGGTPDTYAAVARLSKDGVWYVAVLNGRDSRKVELPLEFLDDGEWRGEVFRDADDADLTPTRYVHETRLLDSGGRLEVRLASGGGFVMRAERHVDGSRIKGDGK